MVESAPPEETVVLPNRKGTLLVVDDEDGPRHSLRIIFQGEYKVLMAPDGPTAIELAQQHQVDVAVLDIRMSGMSGIEVLERLKYVDPSMEVIMMTAFETTDTMRQALRLRACDYLNKPFDINTMRAAVANAMQRRNLENEIHRNAEKLQDLLSELQDQKIEEQISQTRGEIYASIIHDINGPLTVISGFIQLMNQRIGNSTNLAVEDLEFIKDRLKTITRQVTNCIEISRRYLSFLRQRTDENPRVSVNHLLHDLHHLVTVHPSLHSNQFHFHPAPEGIAARMHGTDFIQVLLNLTVNAFQCSQLPHRVEVLTRMLADPLDLQAFRDGPDERFLATEGFCNQPPLLAVSVSDTGPGIPEDVLPRIFQPFFTTKGPRQGTGLGLNIVHRLVKEAKGALHVKTRMGEGTTFTLYLPAVPMSDHA
jgi:signal transduction histidine kinase